MTRAITTTAALALLLALPLAADEDCEYREEHRANLATQGISELEIDAHAGFLKVEGIPGATEVAIVGEACASRESTLGKIRLETSRSGSRLVVRADIPDFEWGWNNYARLNLTITVPADLALDIEDGSGSIDLRDVGPTQLEDGSGEIEVRGVNGNLEIEDGSGEISIRDVNGTIRLDDGSGSIDLDRIQGDVVIDEDGSGSIDIREVSGSVRVREDGSGSIRVDDIRGDFIVDRDGSGGISSSGVEGRISIPD